MYELLLNLSSLANYALSKASLVVVQKAITYLLLTILV